jgi:hypothetical protein
MSALLAKSAVLIAYYAVFSSVPSWLSGVVRKASLGRTYRNAARRTDACLATPQSFPARPAQPRILSQAIVTCTVDRLVQTICRRRGVVRLRGPQLRDVAEPHAPYGVIRRVAGATAANVGSRHVTKQRARICRPRRSRSAKLSKQGSCVVAAPALCLNTEPGTRRSAALSTALQRRARVAFRGTSAPLCPHFSTPASRRAQTASRQRQAWARTFVVAVVGVVAAADAAGVVAAAVTVGEAPAAMTGDQRSR